MSRTWKEIIHHAFDEVTSRYDQIGRKTGGRTLSLIIPTSAEDLAVQEWHSLISSVKDKFEFYEINMLELTIQETEKIGLDTVVDLFDNPMIGENPLTALGKKWEKAVIDKTIQICKEETGKKKSVIFMTKLSALHPASSPESILQKLWNNIDKLTAPVVLFLPGTPQGSRTYLYLGKKKEFVYRGDII